MAEAPIANNELIAVRSWETCDYCDRTWMRTSGYHHNCTEKKIHELEQALIIVDAQNVIRSHELEQALTRIDGLELQLVQVQELIRRRLDPDF